MLSTILFYLIFGLFILWITIQYISELLQYVLRLAWPYSFTKQKLSNKVLYKKMSNIAKTQSNITIVSSTSCLIQMNYGSKTMYKTKVRDYIEFIDEILKK
jgi:hypothetical protein